MTDTVANDTSHVDRDSVEIKSFQAERKAMREDAFLAPSVLTKNVADHMSPRELELLATTGIVDAAKLPKIQVSLRDLLQVQDVIRSLTSEDKKRGSIDLVVEGKRGTSNFKLSSIATINNAMVIAIEKQYQEENPKNTPAEVHKMVAEDLKDYRQMRENYFKRSASVTRDISQGSKNEPIIERVEEGTY